MKLTIHSLVTPNHRKIKRRIVKTEKKGGGGRRGWMDETVESSKGMMGALRI
jgi:hypothetical protein